MLKARVDNGLSQAYDCVGYYGPTCSAATVAASAPIPKWRHKARVRGSRPSVSACRCSGATSARSRPKRSGQRDPRTAIQLRSEPHVKAQNYFDLSGRSTCWTGSACAQASTTCSTRIRRGSRRRQRDSEGTNLCPTGPCNGNTYPGTWDALGRLLWVGATIDFPPKPAPPPSCRRRRRRRRRRLQRDVPGWLGDPGDRDLPGTAAAAAAAAAGAGAVG